MTTGKTIALTRWTFVDKVMSLLFNILSTLVITFLSRSKVFNFMAASPALPQAARHLEAKGQEGPALEPLGAVTSGLGAE